MTLQELALQIAWKHIDKPYIWGGDNPLKGFDCSGFMIEIGQTVGWFPRGQDTTAQGLRDRFRKVVSPEPGDLIFWLKNESAYHVGMVIETRQHYIAADGGTSTTLTTADAIKANARIQVRPFTWRNSPRAFASPY